MTNNYKITGMTCGGCSTKVQSLLSTVEGVNNIRIDLAKGEAAIDMEKHIPTSILQAALKDHPKYQLSEKGLPIISATDIAMEEEQTRSWLATYKPILVIFAYIIAATAITENLQPVFSWMRWMSHFMAGFFLVFSFFKLLNLKGFVESYAMYDVIAKKWAGWGYVYVFTELALGLAFLSGFNPLLTNAATLIVMSISIIGVLQSVLNKRKIKCACLGDIFKLPMSTVTIIEDALMIGMSGVMLLLLI